MRDFYPRAHLYIISLLFVMFARPYTSLLLCACVTLFAFALFFYSIFQVKLKATRAFLGALYFFVIQLYQLRWFSSTYYQGVGIVVVYVVVSLFIALSFSLICALFPSKRALRMYEIVGLSSLWALFEYARLHFFSGFPFNPFALYAFFSKSLLQLATLFGASSLSFTIVFINLCAYNLIVKRDCRSLVIYSCSFMLALALGSTLAFYQPQKELGPLKALVLQPGLMSEQKWPMPGFDHQMLGLDQQIEWVVHEIQKEDPFKIDMVVLPEVAFSEDVYECVLPLQSALKTLAIPLKNCSPLRKGLAKKYKGQWYVSCAWVCHTLSNYYQFDILAGLSDYDVDNQISQNALFLFKKGSMQADRHIKRALIPLTEYLPFAWLTKCMKTFGIEEFYEAGVKDTLFEASKVRVIPAICIEEGFGDLIKKSSQRGGQLIVSVSNDVWFPYSNLTQEHLYLAALRSLENGVYSIRSSNSGVSALISPDGEVLEALSELGSDGKIQSGSMLLLFQLKKRDTCYQYFPVGFDRALYILFVFYALFKTIQSNQCLEKNRLL